MIGRAAESSPPLIGEWPLPPSVTLGSSVRATGIEREIRARLAFTIRKCLSVEAQSVVLRMSEAETDEFKAAAAQIAKTLDGIEALPVLPREAEDILAISPRERHKWLKDGRLQSIGTRTVKLRGRAKVVTFHVFDPRHIEDVLDRDLPALWRENDAQAATDNRRRAAGRAALTRAGNGVGKAADARHASEGSQRLKLEGWDAFEKEGLLR
ncbi:hypothetical protein QO058_14570 [Bosea vestrisii]|uniref:hypothetical protein n=1 Tax=Bosea vestrisii TaxID=151416 RepID=UPI0024E035CC|nr:hypothetical protein [Bosea vestrisii]WID99345.1 hypothetical protein QO058_14570 [Bosea vestrisii]